MKGKFESWEDFVKSDSNLLLMKPFDSYIEKGTISFWIESDGVKYFGSGSHCYVSSYYWDENVALKEQCDFDNFTLTESGTSNWVCNW